jgi:hypothetical protein
MTPTREAPKEFPARANRLLAESVSLSRSHANDLSAANACMNQAKTEQMSWVEGLAYTAADKQLFIDNLGSLNSLAPESALVLSNVLRDAAIDALRREVGR